MISAILLGAGESKRMGVDKLALAWKGKTILEHCFKTLLRSEVGELVVVLSGRSKGLKNLSQGQKARVVMNPQSQKGMGSSIRKGLQAISPRSDGILIALGDQPFVKTRTINALIHAFDREKKRIIVPSFHGKTGHPVIFHRAYKKELMGLKGDVGGRSIIERHREDVRVVRVKSIGVVKDVDTWQDYEKGLKKMDVKKKVWRKDSDENNTQDE